MRDLNYDLKNLCRRNRDGSYSTQSNRHQRLQQMANDLHALGYRQLRARSLKPKHVEALIALWRTNQLSIGTIKNRLTDLRRWAEKVDKKSVIGQVMLTTGLLGGSMYQSSLKRSENTVNHLKI